VLSGGISKHREGVGAGAGARVSKAGEKHKRRRPSKKLVATLESLADALPELDEERDGDAAQMKAGKVRHRSLKTRPGALKRKERIVRGELARFASTMAQMAALTPAIGSEAAGDAQDGGADAVQDTEMRDGGKPAPVQSTSDMRLKALKGRVAATLEVNPVFLRANTGQ
jgi:hypothetical protein